MKTTLLVLLLAFAALIFSIAEAADTADAVATFEYGADIVLKANTATTFELRPNILSSVEASVSITSTMDCTISIEKKISLRLDFPDNSIRNIDLGVNIGYEITKKCENPDKAALTISYSYKLSPSLQASLALLANFQSDILQFDASANAYMSLNAVISGGNTLTFTPKDLLGKDGTITFYLVAFNTSSLRRALFGRDLIVRAGQRVAYNFQDKLRITFEAQEDITVTSSEPSSSNSHPKSVEPVKEGSNALFEGIAYMTFTAKKAQGSGQAAFNATLTYSYDAAYLAANNIEETSLAFYKHVNGVWTAQGTATVDVKNKVVTQTTTSFSDWAVYGMSTTKTQPSSAPAMHASSSLTLFGTLIMSFLVVLLL